MNARSRKRDPQAELARVRAGFREQMESERAAQVWERFPGRIGMVLAGGGGQGGYEAGALLAFQDAQLPSHILVGTSIGAINAANYAAASEGVVGNAEKLASGWAGLTPDDVGIDWIKYLWVVGGLIAATAGIGNILRVLLTSRLEFRMEHPLVTWTCLAVLGIAVLNSYDHLPYLLYVIRNWWRGTAWTPRPRKIVLSVIGNLAVWGCMLALLQSLDAIDGVRHMVTAYPLECGLLLAAFVLGGVLRQRLTGTIGSLLHRLFQLAMNRGLFANFERTHLLRRSIPEDRLRASPIRVLFPATDVECGPLSFFSNTPPETLARDPGADAVFIREQVTAEGDLILALTASSALPIAFEPIRIGGRLFGDGGLSSSRPLRPALRLGADVLFVVMMTPLGGPPVRLHTFVDVGMRAVALLTGCNMLADREILQNINAMCERLAARFDLRPEEVELDMGTRRYRYVPIFTIHPPDPLPGSVFDFGGEGTADAILQGYRDAAVQISAFLDYAPTARFGRQKRLLQVAR